MSDNGNEITITIKHFPITEEAIIHGVCKRFKEKLEPVITKELEAIAEGAFAEAIDRAADEMLREIINRPRKKTNQWGEESGGETTLSTFISDRFEKFMMEKVNTRGESSGRDGTVRRDWLVETLGSKLVLEAAKKEIEKVRETAKAQISVAVGNFIAQNLVPADLKQLASKSPTPSTPPAEDVPF